MAKKKTSGRSAGKKSPSRPTPTAAMRIAILAGPEDFLRTLYTRQFREALEAEHGEVDQFRFDGEECTAADVLDELRSFGLLSGHKLVVVDNADQLVKEDARPLFERYAAEPSEGATLLLRADKWRKGKFEAAVERVGAYIDCTPETPDSAARWAVRRAQKRYDATMDDSTARLLVERLGTGLGRLDTEIGKLAAAAGQGGAITPELIAELSGRTREEEVWSIQAELVRGEPELAVRGVRERIRISRLPEPLVAYAMLQLAAKLHAATGMLAEGHRPDQVARDLKLWGSSRDAILGACRHLRLDNAAELLAIAVETDRRMKTGLGRDNLRTLEALALRFAHTLSPPSRGGPAR